jgi:hypothetical protein
VYGEYGKYSDMISDGSEATRWGFGAVQKFDSAALEVYAQATFWSFDNVTERGSGTKIDVEDLSTIMIGSRLKF